MSGVSTKTRRVLWISVIALIATIVLWRLLPMQEYARSAVDYIDGLGPIGVAVFYLLYVVCAIFGIPRTLLNVGAGVLFSYATALAVVLCAAATAYVITFQLARTVAKSWVEKRLAQAGNVRQVLDLVEKEGFKLVLLVRMNPFIPGVLKGYGFGTTSIPLRTYLLASMLGFLPIALIHVYLGWAGGETLLSDGESGSPLQTAIMLGGVVVSIILGGLIYWYGRKSMNKRTEQIS